MHDMLGVACAVFTITNSSSDYICATRAQGMASHFSFHNIRDDFEPKGVAEHWIQKINHAHGTFNRSMGRGYGLLGGSTSPTTEHSGEKWDEFMTLSLGLFAPDLSAHLERWKSNGLGCVRDARFSSRSSRGDESAPCSEPRASRDTTRGGVTPRARAAAAAATSRARTRTRSTARRCTSS